MQHLPQTFRISFLRFFAFCLGLVAIIVFLAVPFFWPLQGVKAIAFGLSVIFAVTWTSILCAVSYWFAKLTVQTTGIRGNTFFGTFHFVEWNSIRSVQPINLFGLCYLRTLHNQSRFPLWIPLFHTQQAAFESLVIATAPPDNPLRKKIEELRLKPSTNSR